MNCSDFIVGERIVVTHEVVQQLVELNCTNITDFTFVEDDEYTYEVPVLIIVLLSIFYVTISVVAVVGNFLVMWIVATSRRMQNVTNCFIANLAMADIVIGLFAIPFQFQAALLQRWDLPGFMCPFCPFVQILSVNVSVFTLTAIAVDRHRAVLDPLSAPPTKLRAKGILVTIWVASALLATPKAVSLSVERVEYVSAGHVYEKDFCNEIGLSKDKLQAYRIVLVLVQYLIPLSIISYAYARMALRLWGSRAPGNAQHSRDRNLLKNKKKVIKMLVIVVALFGLCWLPLQTYNVLQDIFPEINGYQYIHYIWFCCDWLAMSNSCYNPFIYGIYNEKFKQEFKARFPFRKQWALNVPSGSDSVDLDKSLHRFNSVNCNSARWRYSSRVKYSPAQHYVYHCPNTNTTHHSSNTEIEELCLCKEIGRPNSCVGEIGSGAKLKALKLLPSFRNDLLLHQGSVKDHCDSTITTSSNMKAETGKH